MAAITTFLAGVCLLPTRVLAYIQVEILFHLAIKFLLASRVLLAIQVEIILQTPPWPPGSSCTSGSSY
jgi:hypothetical protein